MKVLDKLNLGCGQRFHSEWLNADLQPASSEIQSVDLSRPLPYGKGKFSVVYHSNVLEHIRPVLAVDFMRECARICRTGGILRVAVPDLEQICRLYLLKLEEAIQGKPEAREERAWMLLEMLDQMTREKSGGCMGEMLRNMPSSLENFVFSRIGNEGREFVRAHRSNTSVQKPRKENWWKRTRKRVRSICSVGDKQVSLIGKFRLSGEVHHWMYDRFSLMELMSAVGFTDLKVMASGESRVPKWREFHLEIGPDGSVHKPDSLIVEGIRQ